MINKVEDIHVGGVDSSDYPDFCDAYIESAVWKDSGEYLTEEELEALDSDGELAQSLAFETLLD